jgi:hypothetical protein
MFYIVWNVKSLRFYCCMEMKKFEDILRTNEEGEIETVVEKKRI